LKLTQIVQKRLFQTEKILIVSWLLSDVTMRFKNITRFHAPNRKGGEKMVAKRRVLWTIVDDIVSVIVVLCASVIVILPLACTKAQPLEQPAEPQLPVKRGALVIISEPMSANVYIDAKLMGTTPLALKDVPASSYAVKMKLENYEIWSGNVDVKHQQMAEVRAELESKPGALEVSSEPGGARVLVDGKEVGVTPYSGWISAGKEHTVSIYSEGYRFESRKATVQPEGKEVISVTLEKQKGLPPTIVGKDGAEMILIPAGEFIMGSPEGEGNDNEHPQHTVFLDAFYIDKYEVTNAQYKQFMQATGHQAPGHWDDEKYNQPNQPVIGVTWHDAAAYAEWAQKRLPSEAEWEKAGRGVDSRQYPWGNEWDSSKCNSKGSGDGYEYTAPVGSFLTGASPDGVLDMAGNVWEWVYDLYDEAYYIQSPHKNPKGSDFGNRCVLRGGSWDDNPSSLRCAERYSYEPTGSRDNVGFRCASVHLVRNDTE